MRRKTLMIRHHMLRAALFLLLLVSPIGAPALGIFITAACSKDVAATADGPFAMGFSRCGLPLPIEHFYQSSVFLPVVLMDKAGLLIGGALALICIIAAIGSAILLGWHLRSAEHTSALQSLIR